ncbi:MAG: hypothetical protein HOQ26_01450, partial [Gemmatimonadaceae bacterium]|nr:hypothetical protein [Gemmatimonadaceae bacterium]
MTMGELRTHAAMAPVPFGPAGSPVDAAVRECVGALPDSARLLLAVSGGRDSMALLDAATRVAGEHVAAVATFDHGTGDAARRAAAHVEREASRLGVPVVVGRAAL